MKNLKHANMVSLLAMYATIGMMEGSNHNNGDGDKVLESINESNKKKVIPKNHKEFTIQGITVTALSHKRAIEKVAKQLAKTEMK